MALATLLGGGHSLNRPSEEGKPTLSDESTGGAEGRWQGSVNPPHVVPRAKRIIYLYMAGGGVRGGMAYGKTDELGYDLVENKVYVHDLHATILHMMGIDHEKLTYRHQGRDFRLTDVHGHVMRDILT